VPEAEGRGGAKQAAQPVDRGGGEGQQRVAASKQLGELCKDSKQKSQFDCKRT